MYGTIQYFNNSIGIYVRLFYSLGKQINLWKEIIYFREMLNDNKASR